MASGTEKQATKRFLVAGQDGDWYHETPLKAASPEAAVSAWTEEVGDELVVKDKYRVYEVVGGPINLEVVAGLQRT